MYTRTMYNEPKIPTHIDSLKGVIKSSPWRRPVPVRFSSRQRGTCTGWGMGTTVQLGMSEEDDVWTPERVTGKKIENRRTLAVTAGGQHTALLVSIII